MTKAILIAAVCCAMSLIAACAGSEDNWEAAESAARGYLDAMRSKRFAESFEMWDPNSDWGKPSNRITYVNTYENGNQAFPGLYDWKPPTIERIKGDARTQVYNFKVKLEFEKNDPIAEAEAAGRKSPVWASEMLLIMVKRDKDWKVTRFLPFRDRSK